MLQPEACMETAPRCLAQPQDHIDFGQQEDIQDGSQQQTIIYGISETKNLEHDKQLIAINICM